MMSVDDLMAVQPVIPVLTVERLEDAEPLAEALVAGGLPVLELTLRTAAAAGAIKAMSRVKGAIVGAGTVLNSADVEMAVGAGAQFIVTPRLSEATVSAARKAHVPILPGVATELIILPTAYRHEIDEAQIRHALANIIDVFENEGDIPLTAMVTGNVDALECVLRKIGIAAPVHPH